MVVPSTYKQDFHIDTKSSPLPPEAHANAAWYRSILHNTELPGAGQLFHDNLWYQEDNSITPHLAIIFAACLQEQTTEMEQLTKYFKRVQKEWSILNFD